MINAERVAILIFHLISRCAALCAYSLSTQHLPFNSNNHHASRTSNHLNYQTATLIFCSRNKKNLLFQNSRQLSTILPPRTLFTRLLLDIYPARRTVLADSSNALGFARRLYSYRSPFGMINKVPPQPAPVWDHTPEQISAGIAKIVADSKKLSDEVAAVAQPTFENVIKAIVDGDHAQYGTIRQLLFYHNVSTDAAVRESSAKAEEVFREYNIELSMREDLFKVVDAVYKQAPALDAESTRLLEKMHLDFVRNGLALPKEKRDELKALQKALSSLELAYKTNLSENTESILFTKEELEGLPADNLSQLEQVEGKYKMTFKYPDVVPVIKYAKNAETRKRAFVGDQNKARQNCELLEKAVKLRAKIAKVLGYETHAAYVLEERMAKTPENVSNFLNDLRGKLTDAGKAEIAKLKQLKAAELSSAGLTPDDAFNIWDYRYFDRVLLETEYEVDGEKISEYFPVQPTIEKMLGIFEELFGLRFVEATGAERSVWHEDCKQFAVWQVVDPADEDNVEFVGWLYFDLHPRTGKYGHAANFNLNPGFTNARGERVYPVTALVCNFSKPTATKPSLLKHGEVVTLFHELGHGIHNLVSATQYARFHGTRVARDFVEAPSQMLEFWCWEPAQLKRLSGHYLDPGRAIDDGLVKRIVASKHVNGSLFALRQLHFGLFDLTLHLLADGGEVDVAKLWNEMRQEISLLQQGAEVTHGYASFGHLMGGYDSGYYGYLWSEVFAADIFYSKFKGDAMNKAAGKEYRDAILKPGGSRDEMESLKALLGREPTNAAFLAELGITA
ncbi:hypothetical protein BZA70DRAFT_83434 [Myxozyma melibiosi]|uniref:Peptidase M3A/M3B catalytic domain-containing protein n=1 Tax=Myxozyma melibiosi TaxID=54550 RepID=A0ABR1EZZ6_9ASCO